MAETPRVLVIEDDRDVVRLLTEILGHEGFAVEVADDGLTGLLKLGPARADVALLDIMMPDVDGLRLLRQLIEDSHDGRPPLPIIVITGSPEGARESRLLLGADDVLEKPFDPMHLLGRVRAHLDDRPAGSD